MVKASLWHLGRCHTSLNLCNRPIRRKRNQGWSLSLFSPLFAFSPFRLFPLFPPPHDPFALLQPLPIRRRPASGSRAAGLVRLAGPRFLPPLAAPARDPEPGLRGGDREGAPPRGLLFPEASQPQGGLGQGRGGGDSLGPGQNHRLRQPGGGDAGRRLPPSRPCPGRSL